MNEELEISVEPPAADWEQSISVTPHQMLREDRILPPMLSHNTLKGDGVLDYEAHPVTSLRWLSAGDRVRIKIVR